MKRTLFKRLLLALCCLTLLCLLGCGGGAGSSVAGTGAPGGTGAPVDRAEADAAFEAQLQAALAEKEPKQLWAEDFCTEQRKEAAIWRCTMLNCAELYPELLERLFPEAVEQKKTVYPSEPNHVTYQLKADGRKFNCSCGASYLDVTGLPSERVEELLPQVVDWLAEKTGLEQRKWPGHISASSAHTGCVDGLPIAAPADTNQGGCGIWRQAGGFEILFPFTLGEREEMISLYELFSPEELRLTLEFDFHSSEPVVEAYRSCELCYLFKERKEQLVPVWRVTGTSCNYETGRKTPIELFFDAETGQLYDLDMG